MHQIRDFRTAATDVEIISHRRSTDESSDVIFNENRVKQFEDSFLLLNGNVASENLSVHVGTGVRPTQTLLDVGKSAASTGAAAHVLAKGLLTSQFQDCGTNVDIVGTANNVNTSSHSPLLSNSRSSSPEDIRGLHNSSSTTRVRELLPTHFKGIETSSLPVSCTSNQLASSCVENFVSGLSPIPRSPTPQESVFSRGNGSNCETVATDSFRSVSTELSSSSEVTPEDLPALLCSFLFGSPDSVTSSDTVVTTLDEDLQIKCKNGSMDLMLSSPASDNTQFQPHDSEATSCEILGASTTKSDTKSVVSINGVEIIPKDTEKQNDDGSSKVYEESTKQCVKEISPITSISRQKRCRTKTKCRTARRTNSHVKEVQRGISEESGYQTSSENHVTSDMETPSAAKNASDDNDKTRDRDDGDVEGLVLVPSGE